MTLEQRVKEIIGECLGTDWRTIKESDRLAENLGADSLDLADLSFRLEREFKGQKQLDIGKVDEKTFATVQGVIDYLRNEGID